MSKNLYITTTEAQSGKSLVSLGIMELLLQNISKVGFFRPIIRSSSGNKDRDIELVDSYFHLGYDYESMYGCDGEEAQELISAGKNDVLISKILAKYKQLEEQCDFVLCEGTDYQGLTSSYEFDINVEIATNLNCPVLLVMNGKGKDENTIHNSIRFAKELFMKKGCLVIATIINRIEKNYEEADIYTIPESKSLTTPTIGEIAKMLQANVVVGEKYTERRVKGYKIAAMTVHNYLQHIEDGDLIVTPGDRNDIILSSIAAFLAKETPHIAGIVLSGDLLPADNVIELIHKLPDICFPILSAKGNTYEVASQIHSIQSDITAYDRRKITTSLQIFDERIDKTKLRKLIDLSKTSIITPKMFEYDLIQKAKSTKKHIVMPEGEEERVLRAVENICQRDFAKITLLGNEEIIKEKVAKLDLHLENVTIIDPKLSPKLEEYTEKYYEMRKHKGISMQISREVMTNVNYYGTMMVHCGEADGMVSGSVHTTAETIRPALQIVRTLPNSSIVSSVFFMCLKDRILVYGDCAINPNPNAQQLAEIAVVSGHTAKLFGIEPRVAMLSYSTGSSGKGEEVEKVTKATQIAQQQAPDLLIEGPLQYDAAIDMEVAKTKLPNSKVAGKATIFIFPDLNTGNNTYKAVQRSTGALAIGPVLQGLRKPINDLSRGCTVADIINTVAITAIQAQGSK